MSHHLWYNGIIGRLQISGLSIYYARTLLRGIETGYRVNIVSLYAVVEADTTICKKGG